MVCQKGRPSGVVRQSKAWAMMCSAEHASHSAGSSAVKSLWR